MGIKLDLKRLSCLPLADPGSREVLEIKSLQGEKSILGQRGRVGSCFVRSNGFHLVLTPVTKEGEK